MNDDDECAKCGHARHWHSPGGNCWAQTGECGDGCCTYYCDCTDFEEEGTR